MLRTAAILCATLVSHAALACPQQPLVEVPLTPSGATLFGDGGVLLGTTTASTADRGAMPSGPVLRSGGNDIVVDVEYIAPALTLVHPIQTVERSLDLVDAKGAVLRTYAQRPGGKPLDAPSGRVVSTLTRAQARADARGPYPPQGTMTITLAAAPPADAAVLVVQTMRDKIGIAWAPVAAGQRTFSFGPAGKGCVPGPAAARQGARLVLMWIDVHGQKSAASAAITVGAARN